MPSYGINSPAHGKTIIIIATSSLLLLRGRFGKVTSITRTLQGFGLRHLDHATRSRIEAEGVDHNISLN